MPTTKTDKKKDAPNKPHESTRLARAPEIKDKPVRKKRKTKWDQICIKLNAINNRLQELEGFAALIEQTTTKIEGDTRIILSANSLLQELDAKMEEQGKFKVGDWVVPSCFASNGDDERGKAVKLIAWDGEDGDAFATEGNRWYDPRNLRLATPEEIESSAYGEREGLSDKDRCETTPEQKSELFEMARAAGLGPRQVNDSPNVWYDEGCGVISACVDRKKAIYPNDKQWLPFPVFKKLLIKTIEKLRAAREEEEAKKKLEFGARVKSADWGEGIVHCRSPKEGDNWWVIFPNGGEHGCDRSDLTVLNN